MSSRFDRLADLARPGALDLEALSTPLLERRDHHRPSLFRPENMLREARRQKGLEPGSVPAICVLDPDGDIVEHAGAELGAARSAHWACYHTEMWVWEQSDIRYGIIGRAVGSSFSVLVAEQLFASGCELIVSIASAGQIADGEPPYHVIVERALRDEGTSYHYLPPARYVEADPALVRFAAEVFAGEGCHVRAGATWTTDAPFRETAETIADRRDEGILAVEMEAAALYAFAKAHGRPVLCLAHVSNQLGRIEGDFEKGDRNGACSSLDLVTLFATAWRRRMSPERNTSTMDCRDRSD
jgi:purine-nucleoside phosphorylase